MTKREKPPAPAMPPAPPVQTTGADEELRVGVSMCLIGEQVRYDGGHKRHHYVCDVLGRYFNFVPVCPEVELGLGTPRETLRLVRDGDSIRMIAPASGTDHTREHIPVLVYGAKVPAGTLGKRESFADIGQSLASYFELEPMGYGRSFLA